MAGNFTKKDALNLIEQGGAAGSYLLGDEQRNGIMTFYKERSYAAAYGAGLPVKDVTKGSVTYTLNAGSMTSTGKTGVGTGTIAAETTGFKSLTVYLSDPKVIGAGFAQADLMMGMEDAVATKYAQALNTFDKEYERGFLKNLCAPATGVSIALAGITTVEKAKEARDALVEAAFDLSEIKNDDYALDGFDESRIFIDLSSKLFNKLVDERLIEDEADATFQNGIFRIGSMGGFKVRRNEFLGKADILDKTGAAGIVHAIVASDVTAAAPRALVSANAGKLDLLSEDKGYYVEQKFASVDGAAVSYAVPAVAPLLKVFIV